MNSNPSAKAHSFIRGDYVLLKQKKTNKLSTPYEPLLHVITKIQGSTVTVRHLQDRRELMRNASHLKLANTVIEKDRDKQPAEENLPNIDWREELLKNSTTEEAEPTRNSEQTETLQEPTETNKQTTHTETPTNKNKLLKQ